jgi:hypothetical protein
MIRQAIISFAAALVLITAPAFAQDEAEPEETTYDLISRNANRADVYTLDLSVPESPALALLGLDSASAAAPQDSRAFAADLLNFFDDEGRLRNGAALTTQPFWWGLRNLSLSAYQGVAGANHNEGLSYLQRALFARTRVSLGAAQAPGSEEAVRAAVGLTFQLLDDQDPRMEGATRSTANGPSLRSCLRAQAEVYSGISTAATAEAHDEVFDAFVNAERVRLHAAGTEPSQIDQLVLQSVRAHIDELNDEVLERTDELVVARSETYVQNLNTCYEEWRDRQADAPSWLLSVGQGYISEDGAFDNLDAEGVSVWTSYRQGLSFGRDDLDSSFTLYGRYSQDERNEQEGGGIAEADTGVAAVSFNVARRDAWEARLEAAWVDRDYHDAAVEDEDYTQVSGSLAYRVNDTLWVKAAYGARDNEDDEFVRVSLVFAGGEGGGPVASALRAIAGRH